MRKGQFGTLCSFGFILVYILISAAAPAYLASLGKLTCRSRAYCLGALGFLLLPLLGTIGIPGSELFPTPDASGLVLLGVFMTYMGLGLGWLLLQRARPPTLVGDMQDAIERVHLEFAPTLAASSLTSTVADPASRA